MRLIYFGTPQEAVLPLVSLEAEHEILCVVTSEDKPRGRGQKVSPTPVKKAAQELGLQVVHTPEEAIPFISDKKTLGVVVGFGKIIKQPVLDALDLINIHFSLLPRWRGAAPVERAILAGDKKTGVCLMKIEASLDTGAIYAQAEIDIDSIHTAETLKAELVELGIDLLLETLKADLADLPVPKLQTGAPTWAEKITPADLELNLSLSAEELLKKIRVGRAWIKLEELGISVSKQLKIRSAELAHSAESAHDNEMNGSKCYEKDGEIYISTSSNQSLKLINVQPEGKKVMPAMDWYRGQRR